MTTAKRASLPIRSQEDVVMVRQAVRGPAVEIGLSLIDQTKVVTAASELARNTFLYGGGGSVLIEQLEDAGRRGSVSPSKTRVPESSTSTGRLQTGIQPEMAWDLDWAVQNGSQASFQSGLNWGRVPRKAAFT